ncbi:hypothetical protein MNEG_15867, partial [Monoraphidium neglectum]
RRAARRLPLAAAAKAKAARAPPLRIHQAARGQGPPRAALPRPRGGTPREAPRRGSAPRASRGSSRRPRQERGASLGWETGGRRGPQSARRQPGPS